MSPRTDPELVRRGYQSEANVAVRAAASRWAEGPDSRVVCVDTVAAVSPRRVADVSRVPDETPEPSVVARSSAFVVADR